MKHSFINTGTKSRNLLFATGCVSLIIGFLTAVFTACEDAEYRIKENSVYITDAATAAKSTVVSMEASGADIRVTVRLAKQTDRDVKVRLALDTLILKQFNAGNNTNYLPVPDKYLHWTDSVVATIPAGEIGATLRIHVDNFDTQGKRYAIPLVLRDVVQGNIPLSASQSQFIYSIAKPLITSVPVMKAVDNIGVRAAPTTPWGITTPQWSLEMWVRMSAYSKNNQCIFDNRNEIYIRFGDANSPYNYLQIKFNGDGGRETEKNLEANTWYHWAFVYDGKTLILYRNGDEDFRFEYPPVPGGVVHFDELWWISSGTTYFPDLCAMSQMRLWKTAISQSQIKNNMYYEIDPANPDLIGYWPMNEGTGNTFKDITGNGHDATASVTDNGKSTVQRWEHDIRFDKQ
ncbi:MAG: DUF1735 and LamG domain-containing protein [Dysgonamonadaceae bacterium]|jgi:hypothetical protein|nr:DUF1735 and LamG domain-containing protein [Dysgonamonadaceae bacterium]